MMRIRVVTPHGSGFRLLFEVKDAPGLLALDHHELVIKDAEGKPTFWNVGRIVNEIDGPNVFVLVHPAGAASASEYTKMLEAT